MWNSDNLLGKDTFDLFNVPVAYEAANYLQTHSICFQNALSWSLQTI